MHLPPQPSGAPQAVVAGQLGAHVHTWTPLESEQL
jgi:hypothetical protein